MVGLSDLYSHYNQSVLVPYPELQFTYQAAGIIEIRKEAYRRPGSTEPVETPLLYEYLARVPYSVDTNRRTGGDVVAGTDVHTQYI